MQPLLLVLAAGGALLIAYFTYGRWLSRRIFDTEGPDAADHPTPAHTLKDDADFVPTKRSILFGHHFTSIAGTGPIVGPAIAVMWGWLPAILWVVFGSIFIGAVHDLGALVVSLRNKGRSIGDVAGDLLGPRVRLIFLCILIVGLWIVLAIFGLVIAGVQRTYPTSIAPVLLQIPIAIAIGLFIHRGGRSIFIPSAIALILMYDSVIWGDVGVLHDVNTFLAAQPIWIWTAALLIYCYFASVLPVWILLQPRDYINALQLVTCLALITVGLITAATLGGAPDDLHSSSLPLPAQRGEGGSIAPAIETGEGLPSPTAGPTRPALELVAPMIDWQPTGAPPMFPLLFITIACGAVSGIHCLVASGTTSKQVNAERDARPVAYGSMLTEGFLATLVIAACAAGIGLGIRLVPETYATVLVEGRQHQMGYVHLLLDGRDDPRLIKSFTWRFVDIDTVPSGSWGDPSDRKFINRYSSDGFQVLDHVAAGTWHSPSAGINFGKPRFSAAEGARLHRFTPTGYRYGWERVPGGEIAQARTGGEMLAKGFIAFDTKYQSWSSSSGLANTVGAFVEGSANFLHALGIPLKIGIALMAVMVVSFAATTLDTACRLQRYVIQEFASTFLPKRKGASCPSCGYDLSNTAPSADNIYTCSECGKTNAHHDVMTPTRAVRCRAASPLNPFKWLATTHGATIFAVVTAFILAMLPREFTWPTGMNSSTSAGQTVWTLAPLSFFEAISHWLTTGGSGGMILWPLFGATNQLLAGFAFIVIAAWLIMKRKPIWFLTIPALFMLAVPAWAMAWQAFIGNPDNPSWWSERNMLLVLVACITLALEAWLLIEVFLTWRRGAIRALID